MVSHQILWKRYDTADLLFCYQTWHDTKLQVLFNIYFNIPLTCRETAAAFLSQDEAESEDKEAEEREETSTTLIHPEEICLVIFYSFALMFQGYDNFV